MMYILISIVFILFGVNLSCVPHTDEEYCEEFLNLDKIRQNKNKQDEVLENGAITEMCSCCLKVVLESLSNLIEYDLKFDDYQKNEFRGMIDTAKTKGIIDLNTYLNIIDKELTNERLYMILFIIAEQMQIIAKRTGDNLDILKRRPTYKLEFYRAYSKIFKEMSRFENGYYYRKPKIPTAPTLVT